MKSSTEEAVKKPRAVRKSASEKNEIRKNDTSDMQSRKKASVTKAERDSWKELVAEFTALGGVAENVELGNGRKGRGLFAIDETRPVRIVVPENLLIDVDDTFFENGNLRIKETSKVPERERAFFEQYQAELSWGHGGREGCEAFFEQVDALPERVREVLVKDLALSGIEGNASSERVQRRFLLSRMLNYKSRHVLIPILELANHGTNGSPFNIQQDVSISGEFAGEALAQYGMVDPYAAFEVWGFPSEEPVSFSIPASLNMGSRQLIILRRLSKKKIHRRFRVPVLEQDQEKVRVSYLMLGHMRFPRLAKGIFYQFMKEIGEPNAEALFDQIRSFNIRQFLKLLEVLEGCDSPLVSTLRRVARYQIAGMTYSIGAREI